MAVKIDELPKMVPADEQPIDLSQACNRKPQRVMPPLIPITLLRSGLSSQKSPNSPKFSNSAPPFLSVIKSIPSLHDYNDNNEGSSLHNCTRRNLANKHSMNTYSVLKDHGIIKRDIEEQDIECDEEKGNYFDDNNFSEAHGTQNNESLLKDYYFKSERLSRKRGHLGQDEDSEWSAKRLDRAKSVPHLNPIQVPLQRQKSLSESQIPGTSNIRKNMQETCDKNNLKSTENVIRQNLHEELRQRYQMQNTMETDTGLNRKMNLIYEPSLIYFDYSYLQLIKRIRTQNLLRGLSLQQSQELQEEEQEVEEEVKGCSTLPTNGRDLADFKRRLARPLTGKHVRVGTGASPATLLSLRRKIQARQQQQP